MKNNLAFNILSKQGLPNGANELKQNISGAIVSLDDFINFSSFEHGGTYHPPKENTKTQKDWMINYIQSPMYLKRLSKEFPDYSNEQLESERNARLSNVKNVNIKYPKYPIDPSGYGYVSGVYYPKNIKSGDFSRRISTGELVKDKINNSKSNNIYLETPYRPDVWIPGEGYNTIPLHEIGHAADDGGFRIPYKTEKLIYDSTNKAYAGPLNYDVPPWDNATKVINKLPFKYTNTPTEFVNRLIPLRYELERAGIWKPGEEDFVNGMYNLMLKNPDVMKNEHINDVLDSIPGANGTQSKRAIVTKLLNEIALNDKNQNLDMAKHGGPGPHHFLENNTGLEATQEDIDEDAMNAMMKARLAYEENFGNRAAKRMVAPVDNPYDFGDGVTGTHYMGSMDNYAIPNIQDVNGNLELIDDAGAWNTESKDKEFIRPNEIFKFETEDEADYFAKNYKRISPMFINDNVQKFLKGYNPQQMYDKGGSWHPHPHTYKRAKSIVKKANQTGFGTVSHGDYTESQLATSYPGKYYRPKYQALLSRDNQLVNNPGNYLDEASALANAEYRIGQPNKSAIGAIPVHYNTEGVADGYATAGKSGGYTSMNRTKRNVVNFPATASLLYDMDQSRKGGDKVQFIAETDVIREKPSWIPEGGLTYEIKNNMDTIQGANKGMSREDAYKIATSEDGQTALKEYWDAYENRTGDGIKEMTEEEAEKSHSDPSLIDKFNDVLTNPFTVAGSVARGQDPWANSGMTINQKQNAARDIYEKTGDKRFLDIGGVQGRYGSDAGVNTLDDFVPTHHFQNSMDNYNSGRKVEAGLDLASGLLSMTPVKTGNFVKAGFQYEKNAARKALGELFKKSAYSTVGTTGKQVAKNQAGNVLKTAYHAGKAYSWPSLFGGVNEFKQKSKQGDDNITGADVADFGVDILNISNPFKLIPGGGNYLAQLAAKSGKDATKGTISLGNALDEDSDTQTADLLKSATYFSSAFAGNPALSKYITKYVGKNAKTIDKKVLEPTKQWANDVFNPMRPFNPDPSAPKDLPVDTEIQDPEFQTDPSATIQAVNLGQSGSGKESQNTTALMYGGSNTMNNNHYDYDQQRKKMISIIDSPMYFETLKKEFPNYTPAELLEVRTNRLNALLMG